MALLPNPWDGPVPTSTEQPGIVITLRYFHNVQKHCHTGSYPYKLPREKTNWVPHYEILGHGPPPTDIDGNPGDVYVDINPPLVVYVRTMKNWKAWNNRPTADGEVETVLLVSHPILADRYLWRNKQILTWVTGSTIRITSNNKIFPKTTTVDPTDIIEDIFRHARKKSTGGVDNHQPSHSISQMPAKGGKRQESMLHSTHDSYNYKKRKLGHSDLQLEDKGNSAPTGNTDYLNDNTVHGAQDDLVLLERPDSQNSRAGDSLSARASELSAFIAEADKARLHAEETAERLRTKLAEVGDALKKETCARVDAEAKIAAIDVNDMFAKKHELEVYKEKLARVASSHAEELEQEKKAREEAESRLVKEEALRIDVAVKVLTLRSEIEELTSLKDNAERRLEQVIAARRASDDALTRLRTKIREIIELEGGQR